MKQWYERNAATTWGVSGPTLEETIKHAKGLRPLEVVKVYFREYRGRRKKANGPNRAAAPQRKPAPRVHAGSRAAKDAVARPRAVSAAALNAASTTSSGQHVPSDRRPRFASSPTLVQATAVGQPYNVGGAAAAAALGAELGTGGLGGIGLPVSMANHGGYHLAQLPHLPPYPGGYGRWDGGPSGGMGMGVVPGAALAPDMQGPAVQAYGWQYGQQGYAVQPRQWPSWWGRSSWFPGQVTAPQQFEQQQQHWVYTPAAQQHHPQQQQAYGYPQAGGYAAQGGGGGGLLGKRSLEMAPAHGQSAGGSPCKLQRGLSGGLRPQRSLVSFGRRNLDASIQAAAAGSLDVGGVRRDVTAMIRRPARGGGGGGSGEAAGSPDGGGATVGGSSVSVRPSLGAELELPSLTIAWSLRSGLGSLLLEVLSGLADRYVLAEVVVGAQAKQGRDAGAKAGAEAGAEQEEGQSGRASVSRESQMATPFVMPEMQERVACGTSLEVAAAVAPETRLPEEQPAGAASRAEQLSGGQHQQMATPYDAVMGQGQQRENQSYGGVNGGMVQQQEQEGWLMQQQQQGPAGGAGSVSLLIRLSVTLSDMIKSLLVPLARGVSSHFYVVPPV